MASSASRARTPTASSGARRRKCSQLARADAKSPMRAAANPKSRCTRGVSGSSCTAAAALQKHRHVARRALAPARRQGATPRRFGSRLDHSRRRPERDDAGRREAVRDLRDLEFVAAAARRRCRAGRAAPSIIVSTSHSCGSRSSTRRRDRPPPARARRRRSRFGTLSAMRDHSSMRRAPSMSSDSVETGCARRAASSARGRSSNEKKPSLPRHQLEHDALDRERSCRSSSRCVITPPRREARRAPPRHRRERAATARSASVIFPPGAGSARSTSDGCERWRGSRVRRRRAPRLRRRAARTSRAARPSSGSGRAAGRRRGCRAREAVPRSPWVSALARAAKIALQIGGRARSRGARDARIRSRARASMTRRHRSIASRYRCCSARATPS